MANLLKLKSVEECSSKLLNIIGKDGLLQLARDGICPHYILVNPITKEESIWFIPSEVNEWFNNNYIRIVQGNFIPQINFLDYNYVKPETKVPLELIAIKELFELPISVINTPPGIYFLCLEGKIQYIGQAQNVAHRVVTHINEKTKIFDSIFFIPCPIKRLNHLEGALIRKYKPPINQNAPTRKITEIEEEFMIESLF